MKNLTTLTVVIMIAIAFLTITGCDEGMNMGKPMMVGGGSAEDLPGETPDDSQKPSSNGEVKQPPDDAQPPNEGADPGSKQPKPTPQPDPETPAPTPPEPTVTIGAVETEEDGSITVSGTSNNVQAGETVTVTVGDVTTTATTDASGTWSATVSATEALGLSAGTTAVTVSTNTAAGTATTENSFERAAEQTILGVTITIETERIILDTIMDVFGYDEELVKKYPAAFERQYNDYREQYGAVFDVGAEISTATAAFRRFVVYKKKNIEYSRLPPSRRDPTAPDRDFEEAYGISADYARELVYTIYLEEKPEDRHLLGKLWQKFDIAMEHLLLRLANPDTPEERILELLRESIRAGKVTIAA